MFSGALLIDFEVMLASPMSCCTVYDMDLDIFMKT